MTYCLAQGHILSWRTPDFPFNAHTISDKEASNCEHTAYMSTEHDTRQNFVLFLLSDSLAEQFHSKRYGSVKGVGRVHAVQWNRHTVLLRSSICHATAWVKSYLNWILRQHLSNTNRDCQSEQVMPCHARPLPLSKLETNTTIRRVVPNDLFVFNSNIPLFSLQPSRKRTHT